MAAASLHHVALRVGSIERATAFYGVAFGARPRGAPFRREGERAAAIVGGPAGVAFRMRHLALADGLLLELIEFEQPRLPPRPVHPSEGGIVHLALQVEDAEQTLGLVEVNGGRRLWPRLGIVAGSEARVVYVADPDENVVEVIEADVPQLLAALAAERAATGDR